MAITKRKIPGLTAGETYYAVHHSNEAADSVWNTTSSTVTSPPVNANWSQYDTSVPESPASSGRFEYTVPSGLPAGSWTVEIQRQMTAGESSQVYTDPVVRTAQLLWDGTNIVNLNANALATDARQEIANEVESQIIDDADSEQVLTAIVNKINDMTDLDALSLSAIATAVWSNGTRLLTAGTNIVLVKGTGITGFNDPTAAAIADAVWDEALSGHATAGTTGKALADVESGSGSGSLTPAGVWSYSSRTLTGPVRVVDLLQYGQWAIVQGESRLNSTGTALAFTKTSGSPWPSDLDGTYTLTLEIAPSDDLLNDTPAAADLPVTGGTVVDATNVRFDITSAQSDTLSPGTHEYNVTATKTGIKYVLESGTLMVKRKVDAS